MKGLSYKVKINDSELDTCKAMYVNFSNEDPPSEKTGFLNNIRTYEQALKDVSHKFYLTSTENTGFATKRGTKYFVDRSDEADSMFLSTHEGIRTSKYGIQTMSFPDTNEGDFNLYQS
jgi:hypothetical protein